GNVQHPDVLTSFGVEITLIVTAIDRAADDVNVGFVLTLRFRCFGLRRVLGGLRFLALADLRLAVLGLADLGHSLPGLLDVFRSRGTQKCYAPAVGRPDRVRSAFGQVGNDPGFPAGERQYCNLRRLGLARFVFVATSRKCYALTVRRPARLCVMLAIRHSYRRFIAGGGGHPDRRFVARALLVHADPGKGDARSVGRELRVGNPDEIEKILLGDGPLGKRNRWHGVLREEGGDNRQTGADDQNHNREVEFHAHPRAAIERSAANQPLCACGGWWSNGRTTGSESVSFKPTHYRNDVGPLRKFRAAPRRGTPASER